MLICYFNSTHLSSNSHLSLLKCHLVPFLRQPSFTHLDIQVYAEHLCNFRLIRREVSLLVIAIKSGVYCVQFYHTYYSFHIWGASYTREQISVAISW